MLDPETITARTRAGMPHTHMHTVVDQPASRASRHQGDDLLTTAKDHINEHGAHAPFTPWEAPSVAVGTPLGRGCAVGIPVVASYAAKPLPEGKGLMALAMKFVQRDDFHGLMELARCGCTDALTERRRCAFALALKQIERADIELPSTLMVRGANLLHYAICIGSFRAAAALVVVSPNMLDGTLRVTLRTKDRMGREREEIWSTVELVRLFCVLYVGGEGDPEVEATNRLFENALSVFELGENDRSQLPYVNLPTLQERMAAAGCNADQVLTALCSAAVDTAPENSVK